MPAAELFGFPGKQLSPELWAGTTAVPTVQRAAPGLWVQTGQGLHWVSGLFQSIPSSGWVSPAAPSAMESTFALSLSVLGDDRLVLFLLKNFSSVIS